MQHDNMFVCKKVEQIGEYYCVFVDPADERVTHTLARILIQLYEKPYLCDLLMEKYYFTDGEELEEVLKYAQFLLSNGDILEDVHISEIMQERITAISTELRNYMHEQERLHLKGFFRFRLKNVWMCYETIVDSAIDEYMLEKQYRDYIRTPDNT